MRIIVPYVTLNPQTVDALDQHANGVPVSYIDVSSDDEALWRLWKQIWADQEDTIVVEHDIVIHSRVVPELEECPTPWCTFGYPYPYGNSDPYHGTGCVRFRAALMANEHDLWDRVGARSGPKHPQRHWCSLDGFSHLELWPRGYVQCKHSPPVGHADQSNSHGCMGTF
jgi:hypothetical protein